MKKQILALILLATAVAFAATTKVSYRAVNQSITVTLNSLANSTSQSTGIRGSAFIDNFNAGTGNLDIDDQVYVEITTASAGVSSTGTYSVYAYGCVGGTLNCTDAVTGTDAAQTLTNPTNLQKLGTCNAVANSTAYICGPFSIASAFGGAVPARWGVVVQNNTGASLAAAGNNVWYDAIQLTSN